MPLTFLYAFAMASSLVLAGSALIGPYNTLPYAPAAPAALRPLCRSGVFGLAHDMAEMVRPRPVLTSDLARRTASARALCAPLHSRAAPPMQVLAFPAASSVTLHASWRAMLEPPHDLCASYNHSDVRCAAGSLTRPVPAHAACCPTHLHIDPQKAALLVHSGVRVPFRALLPRLRRSERQLCRRRLADAAGLATPHARANDMSKQPALPHASSQIAAALATPPVLLRRVRRAAGS